MEQVTFADVEYEGKKRWTRRELFLERMEALVPWERLEERIRPFYPKAGRGRQPYPLAAMLRIHCVQPDRGTPMPKRGQLRRYRDVPGRALAQSHCRSHCLPRSLGAVGPQG